MSIIHRARLIALAAIAASCASAPSFAGIELNVLGRYSTGLFSGDGAVAEIPAYDPVNRRIFVASGVQGRVDVLNVSNPAAPTLHGFIDVSSFGAGYTPNSVAVTRRFPARLAGKPKAELDALSPSVVAALVADQPTILAVAIENADKQQPGILAIYNPANLKLISSVTVGAVPDMVTFTASGRYALVANEGEPNDDYSVDPEGSISVVDITRLASPQVATAGFSAFNARAAALRNNGVRVFGPAGTVAQNLEPEYITVNASNDTAYVSLQEANAIAVIDIPSATVKTIRALGSKDHSLPGNGLDTSDRDNAMLTAGAVNIRNQPVRGFFMPDAISAYRTEGQTYIVTANEGDARDYDAFSEVADIEDVLLDPTAFPNAAALQASSQIGKLKITTAQGDTDGDGDFDQLYAFGARSFSIIRTNGTMVYDSSDELEQITSSSTDENGVAAIFNANHSGSGSRAIDNRSDDKGPEPEGVVVGSVAGKPYAFIGLERFGGVMAYDVSSPTAPVFADFINTRDFSITASPVAGTGGDLGPEGLVFVPATDSPTGKPLVIVAYEVSGTVVIFQVDERADVPRVAAE